MLETRQSRRTGEAIAADGKHESRVGGKLIRIAQVFLADHQSHESLSKKVLRRVLDLALLTTIRERPQKSVVNLSKDATRAKMMHGGHEAPEGGDFGIGFDEDRFATSGADSGRMHGKVVLGELFGD
nr:hypothetical protein [uncultured Sutterella sp.]